MVIRQKRRMDMVVLDKIKFKIDIDELIKKLHMDRDSDDFERIEEMVKEAETTAKPKVVLKLCSIDSKEEGATTIEGIKCVSKVMAVNLKEVNRAFAYVATCGVELHNWASTIDDMVERFWADTICEFALSCAIKEASAYLNINYKIAKLSTMNPGSLKDWPLKEQRNIFNLIGDVKKLIGVTLTESCLMIPVKSVSGILFQNESNYENCQLCPREDCPNRRAPYERDLLEKKYRIEI